MKLTDPVEFLWWVSFTDCCWTPTLPLSCWENLLTYWLLFCEENLQKSPSNVFALKKNPTKQIPETSDSGSSSSQEVQTEIFLLLSSLTENSTSSFKLLLTHMSVFYLTNWRFKPLHCSQSDSSLLLTSTDSCWLHPHVGRPSKQEAGGDKLITPSADNVVFSSVMERELLIGSAQSHSFIFITFVWLQFHVSVNWFLWFWTVGWTKQDEWKRHFGLWETASACFTNFSSSNNYSINWENQQLII